MVIDVEVDWEEFLGFLKELLGRGVNRETAECVWGRVGVKIQDYLQASGEVCRKYCIREEQELEEGEEEGSTFGYTKDTFDFDKCVEECIREDTLPALRYYREEIQTALTECISPKKTTDTAPEN